MGPGKKQVVEYSVTYKRRKVGPELNTERRREPLWTIKGNLATKERKVRKEMRGFGFRAGQP
jgi:hypothetical protein